MTKKRLDHIVLERYPQYSRTQVQIITKPGTLVNDTSHIIIDIEEPKYVCRAGWKLEKALDQFEVDITNLVILDAGLSTGGFTDCLLQRGAKKVYGVDVGYGQVHEKIRRDPRVVVMERTNLRYLEQLPEKVDLVTLDLSFISILKVMTVVANILKESGKLITLIKPQFEAQRSEILKGGIVKDPKVHESVIKNITEGIKKYGFELQGIIESPILGSEGNKEFLAYFKRI